jgi:tetratricopeptide (TPR) repeat protein
MRRFSRSAILICVLLIVLGAMLLLIVPRAYRAGTLLQDAQRARDAGASDQAAQNYAAAAEIMRWRTDLWENAGHYALQAGEAQAAINYFSEAAARDSLSPAGTLEMGDACLQSDDLACAIQWWENAQRAGVPASEIAPRLLSAHRQQADYPAVLADLKTLADLQPDNANWQYQLGLIWAATYPEEALPYLSRASELDPALGEQTSRLAQNIRIARLKDDPAYSLLEAGRALGAMNEWLLATEAFRRAAQARPDYAEAWAYLGEALQQLPETQSGGEGLTELEHALQLDPKSLSAHLFLSMYWQRQGQLDQALAYLEKATAVYPNHPALQTEMGHILALQGDLEAAEGAYKKATELAPLDPVYYRLLAAFSLENNYQLSQTGLPAARRALLLSPNDPASLDILGQVLLELGDVASAKRFIERAILQQPEYAPALLHLGLIYVDEGNRQAAYEKFHQALSLAPGTITADQAQRLLDNYFP